MDASVEIPVADIDGAWPGNRLRGTRHGDAALGVFHGLLRGPQDFRIGIVPPTAEFWQVQHDQPKRHADMRGRDPDAGRRPQSVMKIIGKSA